MFSSTPISEPPRPKAVVVVAAFLFLSTAISGVTAISLLFPNPRWHWMWDLNRPAYVEFAKLRPVPGILLLAVGIVTAFAAAGLLRRKRWAWWIAISVFAVNGLGDAFTLFAKRDMEKGASGLLIACAFLFWLSRPVVRQYFPSAGLD
jgi:hypothetical protein